MGFGSSVYIAQLAERAAMADGSAYDLAVLRGELLAAFTALWVGLFVRMGDGRARVANHQVAGLATPEVGDLLAIKAL